MDRPDVLPVRSSEVMRRLNILLEDWRGANDVQREAWRNQARAQIREETKTTGASLPDRVSALESRVKVLEGGIEGIVNRMTDLQTLCSTLQKQVEKLERVP